MNEAQKFLLNNECDDLRLKDAQKVENWVYVSDIMELYHQEQVKKLNIPNVSNCDSDTKDLIEHTKRVLDLIKSKSGMAVKVLSNRVNKKLEQLK